MKEKKDHCPFFPSNLPKNTSLWRYFLGVMACRMDEFRHEIV
jgi:hypothetical protein